MLRPFRSFRWLATFVFAVLAIASLAVVSREPPASAVKGGGGATMSVRPYLVALYGGTIDSLCSGTLIRPAWVLTAGHCVSNAIADPTKESVFVGDANPGLAKLLNRTNALTVQKVYRQPGWAKVGADAYVNDVALVHLAQAQSIPLVGLAQPGDGPVWDPCGLTRTSTGCVNEAANITPPKIVRVLGFGVTCANPINCSATEGTLRGAPINVLSYAQLRHAYPNAPYASLVNKAHDAMVVGAGVPDGSKDSCGGDSGGPLLALMQDGSWREVAITSWATGGCGASPPNGVYMQLGLGPARTWIATTLAHPQ